MSNHSGKEALAYHVAKANEMTSSSSIIMLSRDIRSIASAFEEVERERDRLNGLLKSYNDYTWAMVTLGYDDAVEITAEKYAEEIMETIETLHAERDEAREALKRMEDCTEQLAATRSHEIYIAMIDGGQAQALLDLDNARRNARQVIAALKQEDAK